MRTNVQLAWVADHVACLCAQKTTYDIYDETCSHLTRTIITSCFPPSDGIFVHGTATRDVVAKGAMLLKVQTHNGDQLMRSWDLQRLALSQAYATVNMSHNPLSSQTQHHASSLTTVLVSRVRVQPKKIHSVCVTKKSESKWER